MGVGTIYDSAMAMRISIAVVFLFVHFLRFFHHSLGLINRSNPYVVQKSYLTEGSYERKRECKR